MTARIQSPMHCVHCNTTETPLWRAGPEGPKTLCNACGVRWKKTGSVIPRPKRTSSAQASGTANASGSGSASRSVPRSTSGTGSGNGASAGSGTGPSHSNNGPTPNLRKRARTTPTSQDSGGSAAVDPGRHSNSAGKTVIAVERSERKPVDAAARVAAASMPAPRPISVFRVADVQRSKYESVFSGLMVVNRQRDGAEERSTRSRTQTAKASAFFSDVTGGTEGQQGVTGKGGGDGTVDTGGGSDGVGLCSSPPPIDVSWARSVYVTEVHAPSLSPSPPPLPKVQKLGEGGGFKLVLARVADEGQGPSS